MPEEPGSWGAPEPPPSVSWWGAQGPLAKVVVVLVGLVFVGAIVAWVATSDFDRDGGGGGGGDIPISEMKCWQLAREFQEIRKLIQPESSFEDKQEGGRRAVELNDRVDELGGCLEEPSLQ